MKLQSKLMLLIYGIVVFSIIFITIFAILYGSIWQGTYFVDEKTGTEGPRNTHKKILEIYENPEKVGTSQILLLYTKEGEIKYVNPKILLSSNLEAFRIDKIFEAITKAYSDRDVVFSNYKYKEDKGILIYTSNVPVRVSMRLYGIIPTVILFSILLLILPAFLSFKMLQRVRKHLRDLENIALNISEGNYDFKLPVAEAEFSQVFNALKIVGKTLKENEEQRGRFFLSISHDLKTPLTSIKGYIEALQDDIPETEEEKKGYLTVLGEKADMLEKRILSLIDYAVADTARLVQDFEKFDAKEFFTNLILMFERDAKIRKVFFSSKVDIDDNAKIYGIGRLLFRCLENLFDNAVKYSEEKKEVFINIYTKYKEKIIIEVIDSGIGIDDSILDKIFDPFFRGDKNRNKPGFGLGLASVKSIVELHKGEIYCKNILGGGSCFTVILPII